MRHVGDLSRFTIHKIPNFINIADTDVVQIVGRNM